MLSSCCLNGLMFRLCLCVTQVIVICVCNMHRLPIWWWRWSWRVMNDKKWSSKDFIQEEKMIVSYYYYCWVDITLQVVTIHVLCSTIQNNSWSWWYRLMLEKKWTDVLSHKCRVWRSVKKICDDGLMCMWLMCNGNDVLYTWSGWRVRSVVGGCQKWDDYKVLLLGIIQ